MTARLGPAAGWATAGLCIMALLTLLAVLAVSVPAAASVDGPCQIFVQDRDLAAEERPRIALPADGNLTYRLSSPTPIARLVVTLHFGPVSKVLLDETYDPPTMSESGVIDASNWTSYGSGLYQVSGRATLQDGTDCTAAMNLEIPGGLLSTPLGILAVAVLGASGVALLLVILQAILDAKDVVENAKDLIAEARHTGKLAAPKK